MDLTARSPINHDPARQAGAGWYGENPDELLDLAKLLYDEMERLDPWPDYVPFDQLGAMDREIYRSAAQSLFVRIRSKSVIRPTTTS
jgi:hypothetical protein